MRVYFDFENCTNAPKHPNSSVKIYCQWIIKSFPAQFHKNTTFFLSFLVCVVLPSIDSALWFVLLPDSYSSPAQFQFPQEKKTHRRISTGIVFRLCCNQHLLEVPFHLKLQYFEDKAFWHLKPSSIKTCLNLTLYFVLSLLFAVCSLKILVCVFSTNRYALQTRHKVRTMLEVSGSINSDFLPLQLSALFVCLSFCHNSTQFPI